MHISQLEAVRAIARNGYNMSVAAGMLNRSQSALSRQIKELERELDICIFARTRNKIRGITQQGDEVLRIGQRMLSDADNLKQLASWASSESRGELKIATTQIHARHTLPRTVQHFIARFPNVVVAMQELDPIACCNAVAQGEADIALTSVPDTMADRIVVIPAFAASLGLFVPKGHKLTKESISLERLAEFPFVAYPRAFPVRTVFDEAFAKGGLSAQVVCTVTDADLCKRYVGAGMGIAILDKIAFDPVSDAGLEVLEVGSLFRPSTIHVAFRKQAYLSRLMFSFVTTWAPHISQPMIRKALEVGSPPPVLKATRGLPPLERRE